MSLSNRELRRLAFHSERSLELRLLLHDALLEAYPSEYEDAITKAHEDAARRDRGQQIRFNLDQFARYRTFPGGRLTSERRFGRPLFTIHSVSDLNEREAFTVTARRSMFGPNSFVVYEVQRASPCTGRAFSESEAEVFPWRRP